MSLPSVTFVPQNEIYHCIVYYKWVIGHGTDQVSLGGDADEDEVIADANLLALAALLRRRVDSPPARLACNVKRRLQVLCSSTV